LGVIRVEHGRGATVQASVDCEAIGQVLVPLFPQRNAKTLTDLVEARGLIEGELAARAAERRTEEDLSALRAILNRPDAASLGEGALAELDYAFHHEFARIADNVFLSAMLDALRDHVRAFLADYVRAQKDGRSIVDRHRPILDAIEAGDADAARKAARSHIEVCKSSLEAYVQRLTQERGR
jgi:DNA-binding FadR family transcriptional regulator